MLNQNKDRSKLNKRARSKEIVKKCYWCAKDMGEKDGDNGEKVFYSVCDDCYHRLGLEERLPQLLLCRLKTPKWW